MGRGESRGVVGGSGSGGGGGERGKGNIKGRGGEGKAHILLLSVEILLLIHSSALGNHQSRKVISELGTYRCLL